MRMFSSVHLTTRVKSRTMLSALLLVGAAASVARAQLVDLHALNGDLDNFRPLSGKHRKEDIGN